MYIEKVYLYGYKASSDSHLASFRYPFIDLRLQGIENFQVANGIWKQTKQTNKQMLANVIFGVLLAEKWNW